MIYLLDGRTIQDHFPGIGRYVFNLAAWLPRVAPGDRFRILYNPHLRNTRYDLTALAGLPNVELVESDVPTFALREQALGSNEPITAGIRLWHSAFYLMPYRLPVPAVVTLEDVTPLILREEMPHALKRLVYRSLNQLAVKRASALITLSAAARDDIARVLEIPRERLTVVPLAPDAHFRPLNLGEMNDARLRLALPERYALYLGSNKPHKNLPRLVEAWGKLATDLPLIIAGHWDARYPDAQLLAERLGLAGRIQFRHDIPADLVPGLVGAAHFFVFPSLHEGFGLPPLEAMAAGVPTALAFTSSLPEVGGEAALWFDPSDVDSIAGALSRLLGDSALRDSLIARGLHQAARFTWERTARETLSVYQTTG